MEFQGGAEGAMKVSRTDLTAAGCARVPIRQSAAEGEEQNWMQTP